MNRTKTLTRTLAVAALGLSTTAAEADYVTEVTNDNPYAYYRYEDAGYADTDTVADQTGNQNAVASGAISSTPGAAAIGGNAITVTDDAGTSETGFVDQPESFDAFGSQMDSGFTIETWIRTTDDTNKRNVLGTLHGTGNDSATSFSIELNRNGNFGGETGKTLFFARTGGTGPDLAITHDSNHQDAINLYDGNWHHLVWARDDPAGAAIAASDFDIFIDGVAQSDSVAIAKNEGVDFGKDLGPDSYLGTRNIRGSAGEGFDGDLDETAFYGSRLGSDRVQAQFDAAMIPEPASLTLLGLGGLALLPRRRRA